MPYKSNVPNILHLLDDIPQGDRPEDESLFWKTTAGELSMLIEYGARAQQPQIVFDRWRKAGTQYIWEFSVSDLAVPWGNSMNWHGQNISQWLYAGAVLLQDKKVSAHH